MTNGNKKTDLELLDLNDLPIPTRSISYPYAKWEEEIPPGKAIEITDQIGKRKAGSVASTITMAVRRRRLKIRAMVRNGRIWVYKLLEEEETIE